MKKSIVTIFLTISMIVLGSNSAQAGEFNGITHNTKVVEALNLLKNSNASWVVDTVKGNNLTGKKIRIKFTNLALLSPEYSNYNALACKNSSGKLYVLIDSSHRNAPAEAIASLLSHEVIHQDEISSMEEETQGWMNETTTWMEMKTISPQVACINCDLVKRLNTLENMYKSAGNTNAQIKLAVIENEGYNELAMTSPGFGN